MIIERREFLAGMLAGGIASAANSEMPPEHIAPIAHAGYESKPAAIATEVRWVQVDLGASYPIDRVKLYPQYDFTSGDAFPVRFRLEACSDPAFGTAQLIADRTRSDYVATGNEVPIFAASATNARYIRLTVTQLRKRTNGSFNFALAKLDVVSGGKDVAEGRPISDSVSGSLGVTPLTRPPRPMGEGIHTDNPGNVIVEREWRRVAYNAWVPRTGVQLDGGVLTTAFETNIAYLLTSWTFDELVREFRDRAGKPNPPGLRPHSPFWERDLAGSNAGRFLMGAGNAVRWSRSGELRERVGRMVDVIEECRQPNGYIMSYPEDSIFYSERGGYTRAWVTHGLIEAGYSGNEKAFRLLRGYYDWLDRSKYLPEMLRGATQGVQGMIANTRMYFTPLGKPADIQVIQRYFQENYWLKHLAARDQRAIWQYPYDRPHCYLITDLEAYLDLYRATGAKIYLDAALGGWELYRDHWEHAGGTIAICEFLTYPPDSYLLHAETGEFCGNVFWSFFNQRFHLLYPDEEKYVNEIEKSIYNVALANQAGTKGIIYHAKLSGRKGDGNSVYALYLNTCCAGQGTRLLGALPEYIYTLRDDGVGINLFESSTVNWNHGGVPLRIEMRTRFPFDPDVRVQVSAPRPVQIAIRVRVPSWAAKPMAILVNAAPAATGQPGSYVTLTRTWSDRDTISFSLPMDFRMTRYRGADKLDNAYALEYGPILMAAVGRVDEKDGARIPVRAEDLTNRLKAKEPLHFQIDGDEEHQYVPYWELQLDQVFTCYPELRS